MHCRCWRNTKSKAAFTRHYARYVKEKCCRLIKSISSSAARRQRRLRLLSTMRLTKPTNPPPGIWPTFGLKSNASGAQPFPSAGNGAEKSQRDFINQPGVDAARLRRGMIQNHFYPAGVSSVLTCADATRSG